MATASLLSCLIYSLSNGFGINTSLVHNLSCCRHSGRDGKEKQKGKTPALSLIVTNFSCQTLEHGIIIYRVVWGHSRLLYNPFR